MLWRRYIDSTPPQPLHAGTNPSSTAGAIAGKVREGLKVAVRACGADAAGSTAPLHSTPLHSTPFKLFIRSTQEATRGET